MTPTIGSLFSGYGGLDLAVERFYEARTVWHCELDPHASTVLAHHWGAPNLGDITAVDWGRVHPVDILCGGFPCQDISTAGFGAGIKEGTRSGLWFNMADAVRHLRPSLVVVENVRALLVRGHRTVAGDLAAVGYDAQWVSVRASDVGAPHRRERLFLTAHPADAPHLRWERGGVARERGAGRPSADAGGQRCEWGSDVGGTGGHAPQRSEACDHSGDGPSAWGHYASAVHRWEPIIERSAPAPTDDRGRLSPGFVEWMMGLPEGWVCDHVDRRPALRLLGNGVVPQQAAHALRLLDGIRMSREVAA